MYSAKYNKLKVKGKEKKKKTLSYLTGFPEYMFLYKKVFLLIDGNFFW